MAFRFYDLCIRSVCLFLLVQLVQSCKQAPERAEAPRDVLMEARDGSTSNLQDWPGWRGPERNGRAYLAEGQDLSWPARGWPEVWRATIGEGYSGIAVAGGQLFIGFAESGREWLVCMNALTGQEFWRFDMNQMYVEQYGNGPRSTPVIDGDVVYALDSFGILHALKTSDGRKLWETDIHEEHNNVKGGHARGHCSSPMIAENLIILSGGIQPHHTILALNKTDGQEVWSYENGRGSYSSPVIFDIAGMKQVVCNIGYGIAGVDLQTGEGLWSFPWTTNFGLNITTPLHFQKSYVFLSTGYNQGSVMLDIVKEEDSWQPKILWTNDKFRNHFNSSVAHQGHIYGFDNGLLKCIEAATGKERWAARGYNKGSLIICGDKLVILGERGKIALVEATPDGHHEFGSKNILQGKCWSPPALANGMLYLRNHSQLVCLRLTIP